MPSPQPPLQAPTPTEINTCPSSVTSWPAALLALLAGVTWLFLKAQHAASDTQALALQIIALIVAVYLGCEIAVAAHERRGNWPWPKAFQRPSLARTGIRLVGVCAAIATVATAYWVLPEYHGDFYNPWWRLLRQVGPWILVLMPFYLFWVDARSNEGSDAHYKLGAQLLGHEVEWQCREVLDLAGSWIIKGFFLPLMWVYLQGQLVEVSRQLMLPDGAPLIWYHRLYNIAFAIDLLFCIAGYSFALKGLGTQVRSVQPAMAGWVVALMCYQPMWSVFGTNYLHYESRVFWDGWLQDYAWLQVGWGLAIVLLLGVYSLSTVAFGLRFSNLTYRGIVTSGPYRLSKHPAYISKNLSWWLISVPFLITENWQTSLRNCLGLLGINLVYWYRAKTEEKHLSEDPDYVTYSRWIAHYGLLARVRNLVRSKPVDPFV